MVSSSRSTIGGSMLLNWDIWMYKISGDISIASGIWSSEGKELVVISIVDAGSTGMSKLLTLSSGDRKMVIAEVWAWTYVLQYLV